MYKFLYARFVGNDLYTLNLTVRWTCLRICLEGGDQHGGDKMGFPLVSEAVLCGRQHGEDKMGFPSFPKHRWEETNMGRTKWGSPWSLKLCWVEANMVTGGRSTSLVSLLPLLRFRL